MNLRVESMPGALPPDERGRRAILHWLEEIFGPVPVVRRLRWDSNAAYCVVVYEGSEPVSFLRILDRTISLDGKPVRVGGIGAVMTVPHRRGRGYAGLALGEARRVIFEVMGAEAGFLLCETARATFYLRYGWQRLDCPVRFDQPDGKATWTGVSMILPREGGTWSPKEIDLCGLPW